MLKAIPVRPAPPMSARLKAIPGQTGDPAGNYEQLVELVATGQATGLSDAEMQVLCAAAGKTLMQLVRDAAERGRRAG
jgi:hypothetical protein